MNETIRGDLLNGGPRVPADDVMNSWLGDSVFTRKRCMTDAARSVSFPNLDHLFRSQFGRAGFFSICQPSSLNCLRRVPLVRVWHEVRRPYATNVSAVAQVGDDGRISGRLLPRGEYVCHNVRVPNPPAKRHRSSPIPISSPGPYPACSEIGTMGLYRTILVHARPESVGSPADCSRSNASTRAKRRSLHQGPVALKGSPAPLANKVKQRGTLVLHRSYPFGVMPPDGCNVAGVHRANFTG